MIEKQLVVDTDDGPMTAFVWHPETDTPLPAVVVYHDGPGLRQATYDAAKTVAEQGYYAVMPDLYHRSGQLLAFDFSEVEKGPDSPEFQRVVKAIMDTSTDMMAADTYALVAALDGDDTVASGPKGVHGFCHTVRAVIRVMGERPDVFAAGSMFHPSFCVTDDPDSPHLEAGRIRGAVFAAFGADDHVASLEQQRPLIEELRRPEVAANVTVIDGVGHGYAFAGTPAYDADAAARSWAGAFGVYEHLAAAHARA